MAENFDEKLMADHEYDGIYELDNDLPGWWVWLFYLTIIWAFLYMFFYHISGIGYSSTDEYRKEINPDYIRVESGQPKLLGIFPEYRPVYYDDKRHRHVSHQPLVQFVEEKRESDTATYVALTDAKSVSQGKEIFMVKCVSCHGKFGEGGIGPNLTDAYWLHGGDFSNIVKTIKFGVPTKGMITWRYELKPEQILQVASFVATLKGTNPPNPKAPQGELLTQ